MSERVFVPTPSDAVARFRASIPTFVRAPYQDIAERVFGPDPDDAPRDPWARRPGAHR